MTLAGKVAIITGAASGIGAAAARRFVEEGATVVLTDIADEAGAALAAELGDTAIFLHLDVTNAEEWAAVVERTTLAYGVITTLVNNAGIGYSASIAEMTVDDFRRVLEINLVSNFLGIKAVAASMRASGGGSIINTSSVAGLVGSPAACAYTASKFGNRGLSKAAAVELATDKIRVNSVHPGLIRTPLLTTDAGTRAMIEAASKVIPLGRVGEPEEVANLMVYLASDASSYSTGAEFVVDAGFSAV